MGLVSRLILGPGVELGVCPCPFEQALWLLVLEGEIVADAIEDTS